MDDTDCLACWLIWQMGFLPKPSPAYFDVAEFEHEPAKPGHVGYCLSIA